MITIQEALQIIQQQLPPAQTTRCPIERAPGFVLAQDVDAPEPAPRFTNSAMDGFAVRWEDIQRAGADHPISLKIIGESQAGFPFKGEVHPGTAVRINTGAMLPPGSDTVIPVEEVHQEQAFIEVRTAGSKGQHVRYQGEEFQKGERLLKAGTVLSPRHIALLASLGIDQVSVYRPPAVAVLVTGSELVDFRRQPSPGQIRESNGLMLRTLVTASGGEVVYQTVVPDDLMITRTEIRKAADRADILIFSGGVSVGPHDHVKHAAAAEGFRALFWKVKQKPGKPLFFARQKETLLFGLPGNPVSAFMTYSYYVHPVLQKLRGREFSWSVCQGQLLAAVANPLERTVFLRVEVQKEGDPPGYRVKPLKRQGSHMLTSIARADGFIILEPGRSLGAGERVRVYRFPE